MQNVILLTILILSRSSHRRRPTLTAGGDPETSGRVRGEISVTTPQPQPRPSHQRETRKYCPLQCKIS